MNIQGRQDLNKFKFIMIMSLNTTIYIYICKMQGRDNQECRTTIKLKREGSKQVGDKGDVNADRTIKDVQLDKQQAGKEVKDKPTRPWVPYFQKGKARILSSAKVVGNPGNGI